MAPPLRGNPARDTALTEGPPAALRGVASVVRPGGIPRHPLGFGTDPRRLGGRVSDWRSPAGG